jgi:hypothetical protein
MDPDSEREECIQVAGRIAWKKVTDCHDPDFSKN